MNNHYEFAVIGGGPAGLSAATLAAERGVDTVLFDEQSTPGGQIYRATEAIPLERAEQLGSEYQRGAPLVQTFRASGAAYFPYSKIWSLNHRREIGLLRKHQAQVITADQVLIAGGAMERPLPFPGWTLPGVMTAGAGQILFKANGIVPADGVVLAGSGPLLLLLAWQYMHAGVEIKAVLNTAPSINRMRALPHLAKALLAHHYVTKGLGYQQDLDRAGIITRNGVRELRAHGAHALEAVTFRHKGQEQRLESDLLLVHFGVIPNSHLSQTAGCVHYWDKRQQCMRPRLDLWGHSSINGILVAGDGAGIGGARTAEHAGRLAAFQALHELGRLSEADRNRLGRDDRRWMLEELRIRPFLESLFHIPKNMLVVPDDDTLVCRCEEVSAGAIRAAVAAGHRDSNQVKFITRCGMGPCQGRQCAAPVSHVVAAAIGRSPEESGQYRVRPPVNPLTLGQLAALYPDETE